MTRRWHSAVVVGASSGIGEAVARQLAGEGTGVALVARRRSVLEALAGELRRLPGAPVLAVFPCDVRVSEYCRDVFRQVVDAFPDLDLVVYASGIMPEGARHGYPTDQDIAAIETNFAGAVAWLNEASRFFDGRGRGTIVGIGSIAGDRGRRMNPVYNATKAALATYLESLRSRLRPRNVRVVTVKPGLVRTPMIGSRLVGVVAVSAERAASDTLLAAERGKRVVYVPSWWAWPARLLRLVPSPIMERLPI